MPITQKQLLDLLHESRANLQAHNSLMHSLTEYMGNAKQRFYNNPDLHTVLAHLQEMLRYSKPMQDIETLRNEKYYSKKRIDFNAGLAAKAARARRAAGIPTVEEAMAILHAKNALRRAGLPTNAESYQSQEERTAQQLLHAQEVLQREAQKRAQEEYTAFRQEMRAEFRTGMPEPLPMRMAEAEALITTRPQETKPPAIEYHDRPEGPKAQGPIPTDIDEDDQWVNPPTNLNLLGNSNG